MERNPFAIENEDPGMHCGNAIANFGSGAASCKEPGCQKPSVTFFSGYCISCATRKGINPLKDCGLAPIKVTEDSANSA